MLFDYCGCHFAFLAPKWSEFNRFYKVFWSTFFDAPKCSRTNAFSTFREVVKRHQLLVKNLMLFWSFQIPFCDFDSKWSEFDRFIRYFDQLFCMLRNGLRQCFFDIWRSRETPSTFSEKPNAFWILSGAILRKRSKKSSETIGSIRFSAQLFSMLQNALGPMLFQHFQ